MWQLTMAIDSQLDFQDLTFNNSITISNRSPAISAESQVTQAIYVHSKILYLRHEIVFSMPLNIAIIWDWNYYTKASGNDIPSHLNVHIQKKILTRW